MAQIIIGGDICGGDSLPPAGASIGYFQTIPQLRAETSEFTVPVSVYVAGNAVAGDGGGGLYTFEPTSTAADDGATVINQTNNTGAGRWVLQIQNSTDGHVVSPVGTATDFSPPWGFSASVPDGARSLLYEDAVIGSGAGASPALWLSRTYTLANDYQADFVGAPGSSAPFIYVQVESSGGTNLQPHGIMSYVINNGSQDSVAVSGRVVRAQSALPDTGSQQASGYYGSAFNNSTNPGATMGLEGVIFNNGGSQGATDYLQQGATGGWTVAAHLAALSTTYPATAILALDSVLNVYKGAWNGIILDASIFPAAASNAGTVGINCGSWGLGGNGHWPEVGMKFGNANVHVRFQDAGDAGGFDGFSGQYKFYGGLYNAVNVACGIQVISATGLNSYFDFYENTVHQANMGYFPVIGAFCLNDLGVTDTRVNGNGKRVYFANTPNGYGLTIGAGDVRDGYVKFYRQTSVATMGAYDVFSDVGGTNTNVFRVQANGNVLNTNNAYGAISDRRLKENIVDAKGYLNKLNQLHVVNFSLKSEKSAVPTQLGFIADEVQGVMPKIVDVLPDENATLIVKMSVFVPAIIKAMQEQTQIINGLQTRIAALEKPA